jgi:hypothetical protein
VAENPYFRLEALVPHPDLPTHMEKVELIYAGRAQARMVLPPYLHDLETELDGEH